MDLFVALCVLYLSGSILVTLWVSIQVFVLGRGDQFVDKHGKYRGTTLAVLFYGAWITGYPVMFLARYTRGLIKGV
jgi:hypothetical protein